MSNENRNTVWAVIRDYWRSRPHISVWLIGCGLGLCSFLLFSYSLSFSFVNFDDDIYVSQNAYVLAGITRTGLVWAFTRVHESYWLPLTWLSYMLDASLFGAHAWGYHFTNTFLHAVNAVLLFFLLWRCTRRHWLAACVALFFAIHPLRVESVAWIAERKDVLSTLWWLLGLHAYVSYVSRPDALRYAGVCACMVLGLMSKPTVVAFPITLLLLDWWPLQRISTQARYGRATMARVMMEKIPFVVLSALWAFITYATQASSGAVHSFDDVTPGARIVRMVVNYTFYVVKTFLPLNLSVAYPPHLAVTHVQWALSLTLLLGISAFVLYHARHVRYLAVGWFWYIMTLLPNSGIVPVGIVWAADRFSYMPQVGLFMMIVWASDQLTCGRRHGRLVVTLGAALAALYFSVLTVNYLSAWRNSTTLFEHALHATEMNYIAHDNLGRAMEDSGHFDAAIEHYTASLKINPGFGDAYANLGNVYKKMGRFEESVGFFEEAVRRAPGQAKIHNNLGSTLFEAGRPLEALPHLEKAVALNPDLLDAHFNLALALMKTVRYQEAGPHLERVVVAAPLDAMALYLLAQVLVRQANLVQAVQCLKKACVLQPSNVVFRTDLGVMLNRSGRRAEAIVELRNAYALDRRAPLIKNNLAWALINSSETTDAETLEAVALAERAVKETARGDVSLLSTLAAAYAAQSRFAEALKVATQALILAQAEANTNLMLTISARLNAYRSNKRSP